MFKKLKDKIAEEVKISPQRFQQLTQSVTEKIQNATSDESFFSIGDDDAASASPNPEPGFSTVPLSNSGRLRRNSSSSVASDMSFLPRYESTTNLYHLQSDLDISASEVEDNASTSSQLGHLSKEQIYAAFQKAQMRYHKYRGRYTDIANHYRELERENAKMKSVLVETQDKALRRVAELREQCSLEQKAKAHLENALRVELDEKQYVIDTLKTKVSLLQTCAKNNGDQNKPELLVDIGNSSSDSTDKQRSDASEVLTKELQDARADIDGLNLKLQEMKASAIVAGSREATLKSRVAELEETVRTRAQEHEQVLERERENNLIIAQTKMELHTEIQNRDLEIENLKHDVEVLRADLEQYENRTSASKAEEEKAEQLRVEAHNLRKTVDLLNAKVEQLEEEKSSREAKLLEKENELQKLLSEHKRVNEEKLKLQQELKQQEEEFDERVVGYREGTKQMLLTLETKIKDGLKADYDKKEEKMTSEFQEKLQQLSSTDNNIKEIQMRLFEKEQQVDSLEEKLKIVEDTLERKLEKYKDLETNHLDLISESTDVRNSLAKSEKENTELRKNVCKLEENLTAQKEKMLALNDEKAKLSNDFENLRQDIKSLRQEKESLQNEVTNLQKKLALADNATLALEESNSDLHTNKLALQNEVADLRKTVSDLKQLNSSLEERIDQITIANGAFQQDIVILQEKLTDYESNTCKQEEFVAVETELIDTKQLLAEARRTSEDTKQVLNKKLKEQKAQYHSDIQGLNNEISGFKDKNRVIQETIDEYKKKLSEYEKRNLQLQAFTAEVDKLKQLLDVAKAEYLSLSQSTESLKEELLTKNNSLNRLREENEELKQELQSSIDQNNNLKEQVSQVESKVMAEKEENEKLHQQVLRLSNVEAGQRLLEEKIQELEQRSSGLDGENQRLQKEVNRLQDQDRRQEEESWTLRETNCKALEEISELNRRNGELSQDYSQVTQENESLLRELAEVKLRCEALDAQKTQQDAELQQCKAEIERLQPTEEQQGIDKLENEVKDLHLQVTQLQEHCEAREKRASDLEAQLRELEHQYSELVHERQLLQDEVQELKISPINVANHLGSNKDKLDNLDIINSSKIYSLETPNDVRKLREEHEKEINHLHEKIVQYKSLDLTNRTSIQFYENELQKLKNKNEKLNRKLDETLVTLNHCTELSTSTETEYLRNVLYNYMLGKEGLVLARVIAAVCKFDETQTEAILQREQQKQTLLGQLGFL